MRQRATLDVERCEQLVVLEDVIPAQHAYQAASIAPRPTAPTQPILVPSLRPGEGPHSIPAPSWGPRRARSAREEQHELTSDVGGTLSNRIKPGSRGAVV